VGSGELATFKAQGKDYVGKIAGVDVTISSEKIGISSDKSPNGPALKLIKGTALTSKVKLTFSSPITALELGLGDYDISLDGSNNIAGNFGAEYTNNFSIPPTEIGGDMKKGPNGEVYPSKHDSYGFVKWDNLEGIREISFTHNRGSNGLGVFLTGLALTPQGKCSADNDMGAFNEQKNGVFAGKVAGVDVTINSDGIGIKPGTDSNGLPALTIIDGSALSSRVTFKFGKPILAFAVGLGDYDMSDMSRDSSNNKVSNFGAEYANNFSIPPTKISGDMKKGPNGEVYPIKNDSNGMVKWENLEGVSEISFTHNRDSNGLGVLLSGVELTHCQPN
jgi:hypothetical protein